jgi:hypothetical protein
MASRAFVIRLVCAGRTVGCGDVAYLRALYTTNLELEFALEKSNIDNNMQRQFASTCR